MLAGEPPVPKTEDFRGNPYDDVGAPGVLIDDDAPKTLEAGTPDCKPRAGLEEFKTEGAALPEAEDVNKLEDAIGLLEEGAAVDPNTLGAAVGIGG